MNKKEKLIAMKSAISATCSLNYLQKRYSTLKDEKINLKLPIIISSDILKLKTKDFFELLKKLLGNVYEIAIQKKKIRAGKGKMRGRRYKANRGLLLVIGKNEDKKISGIDVIKVNDLKISCLYPLGRLAIYTENAVKDLEKFGEKASR